MMSRRAFWVFLLLLLGSCGYTRFKGAIPIVRDATSLRVVGAFSPDGTQFAAGVATLSGNRGETGVLKLWRRGPTPDMPGTWKLTAQVNLTDLLIVDLVFSPDGRTV